MSTLFFKCLIIFIIHFLTNNNEVSHGAISQMSFLASYEENAPCHDMSLEPSKVSSHRTVGTANSGPLGNPTCYNYPRVLTTDFSPLTASTEAAPYDRAPPVKNSTALSNIWSPNVNSESPANTV